MPSFMAVGQCVFIRTVGFYYTGRVVEVGERFLVLSDAAWIADTDRWADTMAKGTLSEVEPYPNLCAVLIDSILDVAPWPHPLPREQK